MVSEESGRKPVAPAEDVTEVLSENAEKFKLLFDRSPLPKWVIELETLRFLDVNDTAVEHYGYSREEFLRMSVLDVRTPEAGKALQIALSRPPYRPAERDSCQHRKKDGAVIDVELRSSEITFAGKKVWLVSVNDITERKRAEEALQRALAFDQAVMTSMGEGLYTVDAQGLVTSMNPAAEKLFGWTLEELRGKRMHDVTHYKHSDGRPFPSEECAGFRVLNEGKRLVDHEDVFIRKDGTFFDVVYSSSPLYEGESLTGLVVVFRDVSERKRAEEALRKSEQRFTQFMRHLPGLAWIKDAQGRYVYANDTAQKVFGKPGADVRGKTDAELFPPGTAAQFTRNDQQALTSDSGIQTIESLAHDDGIVHHSIVSKFPIPSDTNEEGIMVGGVAFDITERKQAEEALRESEERFRLLADTAPVLIWVDGLDGCEFVNREYLQFLGRTMKEVQGMNWGVALHPDDARTHLAAYRQAFEQRTPFEAQFRFRREDGEYRWMKSAGLPRFIADGRFLGFVGCALDISDVKRSEEALAEADRRKNEFLAMLAHELRNPLAPIRNALEILRMAQSSEGSEEWRLTRGENAEVDPLATCDSLLAPPPDLNSPIDMMDRQIGRMVRLVDDLLDVSRISQGKINLRTGFIDLASSVNEAVETVRPLSESRGLSLTVTLPAHPVFLNADPIRLAQAVENLLNNACKFTDKGGSVWLTADVLESGEEREEKESCGEVLAARRASLTTPYVVIRVRDTGIGISASQLSSIFDMFTQVDTSLERTRSGLGIGLTLAKNLVELHGGTLEAHSAGLGQGSEFVVRLPLASNETKGSGSETRNGYQSPIAAAHPVPSRNKRRILVVDDNVDAAESLTVLLNLTGNETRTAYDGLEAVEAAATFRPDMILLDIGLPELNGYDVARKIREQSWGERMILVALTGWGQDEDRRRSKEAGFNHHLTKPVDPVTLKKLLADV
jgi:PAS domain S-box-containing protein